MLCEMLHFTFVLTVSFKQPFQTQCPMYMNQICDIDQDWGEIETQVAREDGTFEDLEEKCLDKFHKWRALRELNALRNEFGEEKWNNLKETFPSVRNCRFTQEDIEGAGDLPLFIRRNRRG